MKQQTKIFKLLKALTNMRGEIEEELENENLNCDERYARQILAEGLFRAWATLNTAYEYRYEVEDI